MIRRKLGLECGLKRITKQKSFEVRFFGSTELFEPDVKAIHKAVRKITGDTIVKGKERSLPKMMLQILPDGLHVTDKQNKTFEKVIPIRKLSYGTFSKSDIQLLAFNHHITKSPVQMECFVVWCETNERAREIGLALYGAVRELHFQSVREKRNGQRAGLEPENEKQADRSRSDGIAERMTATAPAVASDDSEDASFELHKDSEDNYLSLPDMSDPNETELRTALEDMLKVVEEEEL